MGGDQWQSRQGSPYGGAATTESPFQMRNASFDRAINSTLDRRSGDQVSPNDDIEMRVMSRIINDILKGKLNLDDLMRGEPMGAEDKSLPNERFFRPIS